MTMTLDVTVCLVTSPIYRTFSRPAKILGDDRTPPKVT